MAVLTKGREGPIRESLDGSAVWPHPFDHHVGIGRESHSFMVTWAATVSTAKMIGFQNRYSARAISRAPLGVVALAIA